MGRSLQISATEPQAEFHGLECKYPLFVGGFGSGKSETLVNQAIIDASTSPDALIALYAPTYDLVQLILAQKLTSKLDAYGLDYNYNKTANRINILTPGFGEIIMRTLDNPSRIVGYESYRAHIDELDTLPTKQAQEVWDKIIARNRQKPKGIKEPFNRVSAYTTPEGYSFAYQRWIQHSNEMYQHVTAPTYSNPFIPDDYIDSLRATYPEKLIDAYIEGRFVNLIGGNVYNEYSRQIHESREKIKENDVLHIGCDFNVTQQAATVFVRRMGGEQWHAVAELVEMYDTPEMIKIIKDRWPEHRVIVYPDASGGSRKTVDASISDIALLQQAGFEVRAHKQNPRVKDRVIAMNTALSKGKVFVNTQACPEVTRCLEQQAYDKNGEPDKKSGTDHQNDATTYVIAYELPVRKPVADVSFKFMNLGA